MTSGQNSVVPKFGGVGAEGQRRKNRKNFSYLNQSMDDSKLYNMSKNQLLRSSGGGDIFLYFDPEKGLFLTYLLSKLS